MPRQYRHVLAPVDFAAGSQEALTVALEMTERAGGTLTLLHVVETIEGFDHEELADFYANLEQRAQAKLAELAEALQTHALNVTGEIIYGKPAASIVQFASENDVDLVVLRSHKIDFDTVPQGVGSVSHQVSVFCPCPVFLVK